MKRRQEGFTLLELVISMVIFTLVIGLFCSLLTVGTTIAGLSNDMTTKHNQATTELSESGSAVVSTAGQMIFSFPTNPGDIVVNGDYLTVSIDGVKYKCFKP